MSDRDKELWGMVWRFVLVMVVTGIVAGIAQAALGGAAGPLVALGIWMIPLYLANRARSQSSEE